MAAHPPHNQIGSVYGRALLATISVCAIFLLTTASFAHAATYGSGNYGGGTYAGSAPVVTTDSSASISQTSATLGGSITSIGSSSPTVRGFVYGTGIAYGATTTDTTGAPFSTGAFSGSVTSLTCSTGYHFAGYATNGTDTGYGSDAVFTTSACSSATPAVTVAGGNGPIVGSITTTLTPTGTNTNPVPPSTTPPAIQNTISSNPSTGVGFTRDLTLGSRGEDVRQLQIFLNAHGFTIHSSGPGSVGSETTYFGPATASALAQYQSVHGITPTAGYFGPKTRASLSGLNPVSTPTPSPSKTTSSIFTRDLQFNDQGEDVHALQRYLNTHGFILANYGIGSAGHETDVFGSATQYQLMQLQKAYDISPASGYFGPKTRAFVEAH